MTGGVIAIGGNCGYMAGFMAQKGALIVCGDTGDAFADSMYECICFVGGQVRELGNDAVVEELAPEDRLFVVSVLAEHLPEKLDAGGSLPAGFKKVVAGRALWRFDRQEWKAWKEAL
jgi:glutamate synthase domain-containing protein 3